MRFSIKLKVVLTTLLLFVVGGGVLLYAVERGYSESVTSAMEQTVADSQSQFLQLEARDVDKLDAALGVVLSRQDVVAAFKAGDRELLYSLCEPIYTQLHERNGISNFVFFTPPPDSTYFLRVQLPEQHGEKIERASYLNAIETGDLGFGIDLGKHLVALRAVRPVKDADGTVIGYLELGQEVPSYLDVLKQQTGDEFSLVLTKDVVKEEDWVAMRERTGDANDWADNQFWVVAGSTSDSIDSTARDLTFGIADLPDGGRVIETRTEDDKTTAVGAFPVKDATGKMVAAVVLEHDMTDMVASLGQARRLITLVLIVMIVVLIVLLLGMLNSLVFKRLNGMVDRLQDASLRFMGGDLTNEMMGDDVTRDDEIGDFEKFFGDFLKTVGATIKTMSGS